MCYDILFILLYIYVWLDPGTYMIARFMAFCKPGVTPMNHPSGLRMPRACSPTKPPARFILRMPSSKNSGHAPPRSKVAGEPRRCSARPFLPGRPICFLRTRLDHITFWSEPPDPDLMDQICRYRFSQTLLLKSPQTLLKPTRGPRQFRSISRWVLFLSL